MAESIIRLPAELLDGAQSFGIDFGGSVIKVVYIDKEASDGIRTAVRCKSFSRAEIDDALKYIKNNCNIPEVKAGEELPLYYLTGVGVYEFEKKLQNELGIKVDNRWEGECFKLAIPAMMENVPESELYLPPIAKADPEKEKAMAESFQKVMESMKEDIAKSDFKAEDQTYEQGKEPYILVVLGSAFVMNVNYPNGKVDPGFMSPRGGRMLLGLGSILTGAKSFDELMELAAAGDDHKLNVYASDMVKGAEGNPANSTYSLLNMDLNLFGFGWGVGKTIDDFKKEDLVKALLVNMCSEVVHSCFFLSKSSKVQNIVCLGSFAQADLPRTLMEKEFITGKGITAMMDPKSPICGARMRTMASGSYLGALGTLIYSQKNRSSGAENTQF